VFDRVDTNRKDGYTYGMKTAISIPDRVFRSADTLAKRIGVSRSQLYSTAMEEFLARHQSRQVTARLDQIYDEEDSSISPELAKLQVKTVLHEEW
jgi:metal-responsive CopG/Arc/MetJ family transcriptional regulator